MVNISYLFKSNKENNSDLHSFVKDTYLCIIMAIDDTVSVAYVISENIFPREIFEKKQQK